MRIKENIIFWGFLIILVFFILFFLPELLPDTKTPNNPHSPKVDSTLVQLEDEYAINGHSAFVKLASAFRVTVDEQDRIRVDLRGNPGRRVLDIYDVRVVGSYDDIIEAFVPVYQLDNLANRSDQIIQIYLPPAPIEL